MPIKTEDYSSFDRTGAYIWDKDNPPVYKKKFFLDVQIELSQTAPFFGIKIKKRQALFEIKEK